MIFTGPKTNSKRYTYGTYIYLHEITRSYGVKSEFYSVISPVHAGVISQTLFSNLDQNSHASHRRAVNSAFSMSSVLCYESYLDKTIGLFFNKLDEISGKTGKQGWIDLPCLFQYYAFDTIGMLAYGKRYGFIEQNSDINGIIKSTRMILDYTSYVRLTWG